MLTFLGNISKKSILTLGLVGSIRLQHGGSSTIFALSSGSGKCGVAVIRVSGVRASIALSKMVRLNSLPTPRSAILRKICDPFTKDVIDRGLVLWFPGPHSFTGEDCCEFHVHGGPSVVQEVLAALGKMADFRMAESGEFTKRAFYNGKLDLTAVEGLADLIQAETEAQRKLALQQMEGGLSRVYNKWSERMLKCLANVEAYIDFGEEENIEDGVMAFVVEEVNNLVDALQAHLHDNRKGEILRNGVKIAILGEPNVGKSSLLNLLSQRQTAIVSQIPGTTRDVIESALNIGGFPVQVSDTAGLRDSQDLVEKEGVKRAKEEGGKSDMILLIFDATRILPQQQKLGKEVENMKLKIGEATGKYMVILNKVDLVPKENKKLHIDIVDGVMDICCLSCKTEEGLPEFLACLKKQVSRLCANPSSSNPVLTQARHRMHLEKCVKCLRNFLDSWKNQDDMVLAAEQLRKAHRNIGKITGKVSTEEILDVIFRDFCIGK